MVFRRPSIVSRTCYEVFVRVYSRRWFFPGQILSMRSVGRPGFFVPVALLPVAGCWQLQALFPARHSGEFSSALAGFRLLSPASRLTVRHSPGIRGRKRSEPSTAGADWRRLAAGSRPPAVRMDREPARAGKCAEESGGTAAAESLPEPFCKSAAAAPYWLSHAGRGRYLEAVRKPRVTPATWGHS